MERQFVLSYKGNSYSMNISQQLHPHENRIEPGGDWKKKNYVETVGSNHTLISVFSRPASDKGDA